MNARSRALSRLVKAGRMTQDEASAIASNGAGVAPIEQHTATSNHAVGELITIDGMLYKVTTVIAIGETIAAGSNVAQTTIAAELAALTN